MTGTRPRVYAVDEYESQEFDAVLIRENTAVCLDDDAGEVRALPLDKVNHVDADADLMLTEPELPDSFLGGGRYGFVDASKFPVVEQHLEDLDREEY